MKITFSNDKSLIIFSPEGAQEYKKLSEFPGLLRKGPYFFSKPKSAVIYNLINRLRFKKFTLRMTQEILDISEEEFRLKEIPQDFKFFTNPLKHQEIALRYLYTNGGGGLLLEPGMGKTKVVLDFIALMNFKKSLIVCPKPLLFVWEDEVADHRPDKSIYVVKSTDWESEMDNILSSDIVVVNYNKAVLLEDKLSKLNFDFINVDEGLIKDPKTDRTKAITSLGKLIPSKCITSGSLVTKSPLDIFAPIRFLEPSLVGESFSRFKNEYAVIVKRNELPLVVGYRKVSEAKSILESTSIVMTKKEWLKNMPEKKFFDIRVGMGDEQRRVFNTLASNYIVDIGDLSVEVDNPLALASKLVQVSNGFIYVKGDDALSDLDGDESIPKKSKSKSIKNRITITFDEQPKLESLIDLVSTKLKNRRCIIWYNMTGERDILTKGLTDARYSYLIIQGGEKDVRSKVKSFNSNPNIDFLVCQAKSVNYGVTVLGTSEEELEQSEFFYPPDVDTKVYTQIFYSLNFSLEVYLQQQDRTHRIGQENICEYYRLITSNYIEGHIAETLSRNLSINQEMLVDFAKGNDL